MPEARLAQQEGAETIDWIADAAYSAGDVIQLRDGRAGVLVTDVESGKVVGVYVKGRFYMAKTTSMLVLPSSKLFWDHSANKVHLLHRQDRDFYAGVALDDEAAADTEALVDLNVHPVFTIGFESGFVSVPIETAGFVHANGAGREGVNLRFSATAEAQKADALTHRGMAPGSKGIAHFLICINTNGDAAAYDLNVGLASGTHATDADQIAESLFMHVDGNSANINFESDDGTTEVNSTDSTLDFAAGTPFLVQFDCRDLTDIQVYVDGVNVLPASVFKLNAATGPLKCLAHMEKTSDDSPGNVSVLYGGVATAQV
ncbi:MAG: DUF2190 family protein [Gemmataceae bacterium]